VIAVDHIGCGYSDKPQEYDYRLSTHVSNLSRFVRNLDLRDVTLLAHDWGGAIGMVAAAEMPDRFFRFVLFNTAAIRSKRIPWRTALCRITGLGVVAVRGRNLFSLSALQMDVTKHDRMMAAVRAGYLAPYRTGTDCSSVLRFV